MTLPITLVCSACRRIVQMYDMGRHLRDFCDGTATLDAKQKAIDKWNQLYPLIKSYERDEITLDELKASVENIFAPPNSVLGK